VGREQFEEDDAERKTVTIERDELRSLIDQSTDAVAAPRVHTVPRRRPRASDEHPVASANPPLSPLLVLGVIALLITVFIAVTQLR
jgi:hypothetical protein